MPQTNEIACEEKMKSTGLGSSASSYEGLNGHDDDDRAKSERAVIIANNGCDEFDTFYETEEMCDDHMSDFYENFHGGYKRASEHR